MNKFYISLLLPVVMILLLLMAYYIGTLVGFQQGTYLSIALSAASIEHEEAVSSSIALGLIKENKQKMAVSFMENNLRRSMNNYYEYLESEKEVKKLLDDNYILSRFNRFTDIYIGSLEAPAYYVRNYVPEELIMKNRGYQLLLKDYPEKTNKQRNSDSGVGAPTPVR